MAIQLMWYFKVACIGLVAITLMSAYPAAVILPQLWGSPVVTPDPIADETDDWECNVYRVLNYNNTWCCLGGGSPNCSSVFVCCRQACEEHAEKCEWSQEKLDICIEGYGDWFWDICLEENPCGGATD